MKKTASRFMFVAVLSIAGIAPSQAAVMNGGFESGLTSWNTSLFGGTATVVGSAAGNSSTYSPQEGSNFLSIAGGYWDMWNTVSQTIYIGAGQTISGLAAFDWRDYTPYIDGARVTIYDSLGAALNLFYEDGTNKNDYYDGPWTSWSWTAMESGNYLLELAARNTMDDQNSSKGYFDDIKISGNEVPEPATIALLGLGLLGIGASRRRSKNLSA